MACVSGFAPLPFHVLPPVEPAASSRGASRQACHAGSPVPAVGSEAFLIPRCPPPAHQLFGGELFLRRLRRMWSALCRGGPMCPPFAELATPAPCGASRPAFHPGLSVERAVLRATPAALCRRLASGPFLSSAPVQVSPVVLAPETFSEREDFHAATGASCRRDHNGRPSFAAALSRCVLFSPCPLCPLYY